MNLQPFFKFFLIIILSTLSIDVAAQIKSDNSSSIKKDSVTIGFVDKMQDLAKKSATKSKAEFESDKALTVQVRIFEEVRLTMQNAKSYLKSGLDTLTIKQTLQEIIKNYKIASDGVFTNKGTAQTYRNLTATKKIINELISEAEERKVRLDARQKTLSGYRFRLDSLLTTKELFSFPKDSLELMDYLHSLVTVAKEIDPVDSALKLASRNVQILLNSYNLEINTLKLSVDEIEHDEKKMAMATLAREFPNITETPDAYRPFTEILNFSKIKALLTLQFYLRNNIWKLLILCGLFILSFVYLRSLKMIYIAKRLLIKDFEGQLVIRYPLLSALLLVISIFQFIFISPPFILNVIFWLISCLCLTIIFRGYITRYWMIIWLLMVGFFFLAAADNMILQASRIERWFMFVVAIVGVIAGIINLLQKRHHELREKWIAYSIAFMVFLELCSIGLNIFGRYNVSKTLVIGGFLNVVVAILFLWVVRFINEGLVLAFNVYTVQDKKLFYLNFGRVGARAPFLLYLLLILGWVILMGHNFPLFEYLSQPLLNFLSRDRTIGDYTFSINSLFLFFAIMSISVIISKIVSFFTSDEHLAVSQAKGANKQRLGSWVLLVRIFILSIGLFLAIAAAGIPMDRITIIIGALGVGIGFGMQTLVNNLVSGLIIAFEKPVNVGDIVDVDGQGGTMKSIGFRSSIITTWDGADLVMPNGDLLNSHLMNWTLAGNRKRVTIVIGVAYDTELEKCRQILKEILSSDEKIDKYPQPVVQFEQFGASTIDLKIFFWTKHMSENNSTKSDLLIKITSAFKTNNIKIPFPQQDIYLHKNENDPI
ncbi:mechanosensitive ion channel family protein [Pedobacter mucosus]|uniref:mechanosensitive ion channel family protein n=1 Tax=Pedobacter mucosus TaxID=2895286 RepID=UPI001EE3DF41|nr:mechanosensitive ion channel domain-containing protein [Pedobacter mucosus]UKT66130.1 mechanosensitive ion channel [Pedobacter mucosus]